MQKNEYYKQLQTLSYSVYNNKKYPKPSGWTSIEKYENNKTGFYTEAFRGPNNEIFLFQEQLSSAMDQGLTKTISIMIGNYLIMSFRNNLMICPKLMMI